MKMPRPRVPTMTVPRSCIRFFLLVATFGVEAVCTPATLEAQQSCENIAGEWHVEEEATLVCTVTVAGQRDTYSDPLGASRNITIFQDPASCSFRYDPGTIGAGTLTQYLRTEVRGEILGQAVTTSGGAFTPAPDAQLIESSFRSSGQVSGNSMTLTGSGTS